MKIKIGRLSLAMAAVLLPLGWFAGIAIAAKNDNTTWLHILLLPLLVAAVAVLIGSVYCALNKEGEK